MFVFAFEIENQKPRLLKGWGAVVFPKMYLLERGWSAGFFVTFNIISHIFPENFTEVPQVVQEIWRTSPSRSAIFIDFLDFFDISLFDI